MENIIKGYKKFQQEYFKQNQDLFADLIKQGQKPEILVIACSDARVDPAIVTRALPGDLFVIRNVANLIPPYEEEISASYHGTSAALEFGVCHLNVKHIIVFGHSNCGGIRSLFTNSLQNEASFLTKWMDLAKVAMEDVNTKYPDKDIHTKSELCAKYSLVNSLDNLKTFPWIAKRIADGSLQIHAWYFDILTCTTFYWDKNLQFMEL
jgi:carbonic anhydrase